MGRQTEWWNLLGGCVAQQPAQRGWLGCIAVAASAGGAACRLSPRPPHLALGLAHGAEGREQLGAALKQGLQRGGHLPHSTQILRLVGVQVPHRRQHLPQPLVGNALQERVILLVPRRGAVSLVLLRGRAGSGCGGGKSAGGDVLSTGGCGPLLLPAPSSLWQAYRVQDGDQRWIQWVQASTRGCEHLNHSWLLLRSCATWRVNKIFLSDWCS